MNQISLFTAALTVGLAASAVLGTAVAQERLRHVVSAEPSAQGEPLGHSEPLSQKGPLTPNGGVGSTGAAELDAHAPSSLRTLELEERIRADFQRADLDAREAAFDRWAAAVPRDAGVRAALASIESDKGDLGAAFLARLALRDVNRSAGRPATRQGSIFGGQSLGGRDPFGRDLFGSGPLFGEHAGRRGSSLFGSGRKGIGQPRFGGRLSGGDLEQRLEDIQREVDRLLERSTSPSGARARSSFSGSSINVQVTPSGVRVEITEQTEGGETKIQTFEAPTMDELHKAHPELRGRFR